MEHKLLAEVYYLEPTRGNNCNEHNIPVNPRVGCIYRIFLTATVHRGVKVRLY